jgi:di/tricarboxylate transporter
MLVAAVILLMSRAVPDFAVGLVLITGWVLLGVATTSEALTGFASREWLFVLGTYGLAAATARSGLLYRIGLLLVRRLPHGILWQAATLLLTGLMLTPLVPSSTGRASLTSPLALAVAEALRLPDRARAAALLGLGAWVGAGPLMFAFLNGSCSPGGCCPRRAGRASAGSTGSSPPRPWASRWRSARSSCCA